MTRRTPEQYRWDKIEFDETILTKHFTKQASKDVKFIVVHHSTVIGKGDGRANDALYRIWQTRKASAHYGVDGRYVRQLVWDKDYAWATGSYTGNKYGISIEHANSTAGPKWLVSEETILTGARLVAHLHLFYRLGRPVSGKTLRRHKEFVSTACPGPYLGGTEWGEYVEQCQKFYDTLTGSQPEPDPDPIPEPTKRTYVVRAGDTLTDIARRFATTVANLVKWNKIEDPNRIEVGDELIVSSLTTVPKLPSDIIDLTNWKLTLPVGTRGKPVEVKQPQLNKWSNSRFLQVYKDGVVFRVFANGVTTSGSEYPRDELREMKNRGRSNASWPAGTGLHRMSSTFLVTDALPDKKSVVVGQIHDAKDDVVMVKFTKVGKKGKVEVSWSKGKGKGSVLEPLDLAYEFGTKVDVDIIAHRGVIEVRYKRHGTSVWKSKKKTVGSRSGCYYKFGVYAQFNDDTAKPNEKAEMVVYRLDVTHD